jgi:predicted ATP-dependent endonuclease of OLD family
LLAVALALVNAKDGLLLIDGLDNGLHYSVQEPLWRWLMQGAQRRGVQVFATAHNWDCVAAFQQAAGATADTDAMLVCLEREAENPITARTLAGPELAGQTRESLGVC